jgi:hypothetical protein
VTSIAVDQRPRASLRPLALPAEHGGWGFLLEPMALAMIVAPSMAGALIALGGVAVFLVRHPLKLAARDWFRGRHPRTALCEVLVALYGLAALIAFGAEAAVAGTRPLVPLLFAIPFGVTLLAYDTRNRSRALVAELSGAIAPAAMAASIALAAGKPVPMAVALSALMIARAVPAVLYVRSALRGQSRIFMLLAHAMAVAVAAWISWMSAIAMLLLFARAVPRARGVRAQTIGLREIGWGICCVLLIAAGFYI